MVATTAAGVDAGARVAEFALVGILCAALNPRTVRFVTHLDVDGDAVEAAVERATPMLS